MSKENFQDLFNMKSDYFMEPENTKTNDLYKPSAKDGEGGVYKAVIRFLPYHADPKKSKVKKFQVWLEDPSTNRGFYVDCPSTIGKPSIIADTYWKLKKSDSASDQKLSEKFSRKEYYYSLVQIVKDKQHPELEGQIKIFRYGDSINKKIMAQMEPEFGQPSVPFDLFGGKLFILNISQKGQWNNYEMCQFHGDSRPIDIAGKPLEKTKEGMELAKAYLEKGPDFSKYFYQEWTDETHEKVSAVIRNTIPGGGGQQVEKIINKNKSNNKSTQPEDLAVSEHLSGVDDFDLGDTSTTDDDLDDLFNNL